MWGKGKKGREEIANEEERQSGGKVVVGGEEEKRGKRRRCAKEKRKEGTYFSLSSLSLLILFNSLTFHASYSSSWGQGHVQPVKQKCFVLRTPCNRTMPRTTDCNSDIHTFIPRFHRQCSQLFQLRRLLVRVGALRPLLVLPAVSGCEGVRV